MYGCVDRVNAAVRNSPMSALPVYGDCEHITGRTSRSGTVSHTTHTVMDHMQGHGAVHGRIFKNACLNHVGSSAHIFLAGLEHQLDPSSQLAFPLF